MDKLDFKMLNRFYSLLQDDESRYLFDLRLKYVVDWNYADFIDGIRNLKKKWMIYSVDDFRNQYRGQKIIIFGAGAEGFLTEQILNDEGFEVYAYCDNNPKKWGGETTTKKRIYPPSGLPTLGERFFIIIASRHHGYEMYNQILEQAIAPRQDVFLPFRGTLGGITGSQYFDCEEAKLEKGEIFVDMGMYDGETSLYVAQNCEYEKIIGFEASEMIIGACRERLAGFQNVDIYQYAAWDRREDLKFMLRGTASAVSETGNNKVIGESLDHILGGEKATFIKMDIEGSEEKALIGARETISKYRPKLAISFYHKPSDIFVLPACILNIRDDYRFILRHYSLYDEETVLYAF